MEGANSAIAYLPEEEVDAQETKKAVEAHGAKCYLFQTNLTTHEAAKKLVDDAINALGGLNILVNNCAYQFEIESIDDLSLYDELPALRNITKLTLLREQWDHTFKVNMYSYFWMAKFA
jgi:NAD(P)-dependent dehydrogenase (short-subunit alcohol dehydrogenase family)